jgi:hypothetical protein
MLAGVNAARMREDDAHIRACRGREVVVTAAPGRLGHELRCGRRGKLVLFGGRQARSSKGETAPH